MSRSSAPVLTSLLLLLMLPPLLLLDATIVGAGSETSCSLKSCAILDAELLQDYVSSLNETELNVTYLNTEKELLPFGALPSDWSRLLLLQNRQPKGTPLHDNLLKLSRLLLAAHFESDEHHNWTDDGQSIDSVTTLDNLMVDSYTEFDDQHAFNLKFNSIEKNSDLINSSLNIIREIYNNENQLKDEKFPVNKDDPAATSYYDFLSFTISTTNFNQTFFESTKNNETSRNKSNKTLSIGENEDESFQVTTRTSGNSFIWSSSQLNELEEDNSYWSSSVVTGSSFASSTYSNEQSSEYSSENEAMHERSKEKFAISHLQIKDNKNENRNKNETSSISFSVLMSDDNTDIHRQKNNTLNHTDNFNINITNLLVRFDSDLKKKDSTEELLTQSIEHFFAVEDEINRTDDSNFVNSTDLVADNVEARRFTSSESLNSEESKSIEDFFDLEEESNITMERNIVTDSNKVLVQNTETSIETYPLNLSNLDNLDKVYTENFTFIESIANELFVTTNSNKSASSPRIENFHNFMLTEGEALTQMNNSLNRPKLISSMPSGNLLFNAGNIDESNSTKRKETNPTVLVNMISNNLFSDNIVTTTVVYPNEITPMLDSMSLSVNKIENQSAKYQNIPPSWFDNTADQDKDDGKTHTFTSEFEEVSQNRTTNLPGDLLRETIMKRLPEDNWSSTTTAVSIERISVDEDKNAVSHLLPNILKIQQRNSSNSTPIATKLRKVETEPSRKYEYQTEKQDDTGTWELIDKAFNTSVESSRNQPYKRSNRIASGTKMNIRKSRKHAGIELDAGRQYRSLFGLGPKQRLDEDSKYQGLDL